MVPETTYAVRRRRHLESGGEHQTRRTRRRGSGLTAFFVVSCLVLATAQQSNYVVGPHDVLTVKIWDQPDLSGTFSVEADGTFTYPLVGRVKVAGLTLVQVESELKKRLADGYFKNPQVTVSVEQYRSQRIFVLGEVRSPGTYPLTGDMTLIEALARAGSTMGGEVLIVRAPDGRGAPKPLLPNEDAAAEVVRVDLKALERGSLSQNVTLRDGDTIFVPRPETIYVYGQVRSPGAYAIQKGTTLLQALALAGGVTDRGSTSRIRIIRVIGGKKKQIKIKLNDLVQPGDTIIVPERFF